MSYTRIEQTVRVSSRSFAKRVQPNRWSTVQGIDLPSLNYGDINVLCLSFVDENGDAYALEATDEFVLAIDSDLREVTDTADLMAYSDNTQVDIAGDWADISRANGKISIRINCQRALFNSRITESDGSQECWMQVTLAPNGGNNHCTAVQNLVNCDATVIEWLGAQP